MKNNITIKTSTEHDAKFLHAECGVRYWEDATVNGVEDVDGYLIPLRDGEAWCPTIEIETGTIVEWPKGTVAKIHYKVCDDGRYTLLDANREQIVSIAGYVPSIMWPGGNGYGDYVIMSIDGDGKIANWHVDLSKFESSTHDQRSPHTTILSAKEGREASCPNQVQTINSEKLTGGAWWAASLGEDFYRYGPHSDPSKALSHWAADHDPGTGTTLYKDRGFTETATVIYATNPPVRLADWIDAEQVIEAAEDSLYSNGRADSEHDDRTIFDATPDQIADLDRRLKAAADEWQAAHGLEFPVSTFKAILCQHDVRIDRQPGEEQKAALDRAIKLLQTQEG